MNTTDTLTASLLLGLAVALIHATFQLGVSVLTLLSSHSLGAKKAHNRLLRLNLSYVVGVFLAISLILLALVYKLSILTIGIDDHLLWSLAGILAALTGFFVTFTYYRKGKGTLLWLPRSIAEYLASRAKKTRRGVEACALGIMTVIGELPFALASLLIAGLIIQRLPDEWKLWSIGAYALVVCLPLLFITAMLGSGHRLSTVQRWRESNKTFLQFSAGMGLVVIASYITVFYLLEKTV